MGTTDAIKALIKLRLSTNPLASPSFFLSKKERGNKSEGETGLEQLEQQIAPKNPMKLEITP